MAEFVRALDFAPRTAVLAGVVYAAAAAPVLLGAGMDHGALLATAVLGLGLVLLTAVDIATYRLPDILTLPLLLAGLGFALLLQWEPGLQIRALAALGAYIVIWLIGWAYERLRGRPGIGLGDAKLFAVAGAWLGPEGLSPTLLYACGGAIGYVAFLALRGRRPEGSDAIAFGPFLAGGLWLVWLYGPLF